MPLTQGDVGLVHSLDVGLGCHDNALTLMEGLATHSPPVVSKELGSAHHMKDEEGGGEQQHLVHGLSLSHVLQLSQSSVLSANREEESRIKGRGHGL